MARPASEKTSSPDRPQITELKRSQIDAVQADGVRMDRSAANEVVAGSLDMRLSAASDVRASLIETHASALATVDANEVWMSSSAAGTVRAANVALRGTSGLVLADKVDIKNTVAGIVAGRQVHSPHIRTILLVGGRVDGEVHASLDTRQTVLAGLVAGLVAGAMFLLFRRD